MSSFVVNGVDQGAGYFYTIGPVSGCYSYHFFDESSEETICYKVDSYTIDAEKQQVEDERYMQAVEEQFNAAEDDNSIEESLLSRAGLLSLSILLIFVILFICFCKSDHIK